MFKTKLLSKQEKMVVKHFIEALNQCHFARAQKILDTNFDLKSSFLDALETLDGRGWGFDWNEWRRREIFGNIKYLNVVRTGDCTLING